MNHHSFCKCDRCGERHNNGIEECVENLQYQITVLKDDLITANADRDRYREALEMYESHMAVMQKDAENYLIPDNGCNKDWFVNRMLYHLDGPMQREVQLAAREAIKEQP